jgi:uncharacterized protein (TIGR04255 family)
MAYKRPPIAEAVIELRFVQSASQEDIEEAAKRMRGEYFYQDAENIMEFKIDPGLGTADRRIAGTGVKLSSLDRADQLMFRTNSFACSRLAPYLGWEAFIEKAWAGWAEWKMVAGNARLARIGVRYVNRIDVPATSNELIRIEEYLNVFPKTPPEMTNPLLSYAMQAVSPLGPSAGYALVLNTSSVPSPLVGFFSFALDLDVAREKDIPRRDDELREVLAEMRVLKNQVFEYCITDRARSLFG